jgi:hypothetical protein
MFEAGVNWATLRSHDDRRWLVQFDLAAAARFGWFGNQHPFLFVLGPHATAWIEVGRRLSNQNTWSPYLGARLGSDLKILEHPGLSVDALDTINESEAGVRANGLVRVDGGLSMLDDRRSLLLVGFVQEAFQARSVNAPPFAFTQIGLGVRFDIQQSFIGELEAAWGVTPNRTDHALGFSDQTTRAGVSTNLRKIFGNGLWLGLRVLVSRDTDTITYPTRTFGTGNAPVLDGSLTFGWSPK